MEKDPVKIFNRLKTILKKYEDPLQPKIDADGKYDLWSFKKFEIAGRERDEVYFAGLVIQSKHVGFYYMPIYVDTSLKDVFEPDFLKLLKGKSCFHVKVLDDNLERQIKDALDKGYQLYDKKGWI